jgi:anti-anti-sigma factor
VERRDVLPAAFACSLSSCGQDQMCVRVAGDLDVATTPQLQHALHTAQSQARLVILDLHELTFIDSVGVHTIVDASVQAREAGRNVVLLRGPRDIDRVFRLTGTCGDIEYRDSDPVRAPCEPTPSYEMRPAGQALPRGR